MANTEVFIGGDDRIMHLASASKVSTVGLFPDNINMYAPYNNNSVAIPILILLMITLLY
jgi:ADP-heptose:LPS heptosyltransferase